MKRLVFVAFLGAAFALGCAGHPGAATATNAAPVDTSPNTTPVAAPAPSATSTAQVPPTAPAAIPTDSAASAQPSATTPTPTPGFPPCGMPSSLVARGWRTELAPTSTVESPPFEAGTTTLVVLPDTQYYASCESRYFRDQVQWAAAEKTRRNVAVALTLGDLTDKNTPEEWHFIREGLRPVEKELPFVLVTGNHDHARGGTAGDRSSLFQRTFPQAPGAAERLLAESMKPGDVENAYYRVRLPRVTLGVLALEWSPRAATVAWANRVLDRYPNDRAIIVTHAYLYNDGTRYDWQGKGRVQEWNPLSYGTGKGVRDKQPRGELLAPDAAYDGEMLWRDLAERHAGVFLVLSGHVLGGGTGVLTSRGEHGNLVQQVLVNFQMLKDGGLGYLRLLELLPDGKTLRMKTFSPTLGSFATPSDQVGSLELEPPLW